MCFFEIQTSFWKSFKMSFFSGCRFEGGGRIIVSRLMAGLCESRHRTELIKEKRIDVEASAAEVQLVHGLLSRTSARKGEVRLEELEGGEAVCQSLIVGWRRQHLPNCCRCLRQIFS